MATILNLNNESHSLSYLNAYHCFGRSTTNVDTVIDAPEISRLHTIIEWVDDQWFIRDISSNGTWLNDKKLLKDTPQRLKLGDKIYFAKAEEHGFIIKELTPPQNMLFSVEATNNDALQKPIILKDYNLLPSENTPEIALFYVHSKNQWYKEYIDDEAGVAYLVTDLDLLNFANQNWQLKLNTPTNNTTHLAKAKLFAHQIKYRFNLSQDEETTELTITANGEEFYLLTRAHHYLTLSLARDRDEDAKKGIDEYNQGWRLRETIVKELGEDMQFVNTHIFRAKSQLVSMLNGACDGDALIETRGKKIRFAGSSYRIYQGNKLIVNRGQEKVSLTVMHG
ncbi:MAG: FHA domain-containing protein [Colwellia sp.]|nr:FHA domain-containing protein [Colwellia sp.]